MIFDLHIHSVHSDGLYKTAEIVDKVMEKKLAGFALTDHDTFDGIAAVRADSASRNGPKPHFLAGCEFSTHHPGIGEVHILGYFKGDDYKNLDGLLESYRGIRRTRAQRILDCLRLEGISLDEDSVLAGAEKPVGRMHIARELVQNGHMPDVQTAFEKYLREGGKCYIPRTEVATIDVIKAVRDAGGIPVAAHPYYLQKRDDWRELGTLVKTGLLGLEYKHPRVKNTLSRELEEYANGRLNPLILTGGSDFHGDGSQEAIGRMGVDAALFMERVSAFRTDFF